MLGSLCGVIAILMNAAMPFRDSVVLPQGLTVVSMAKVIDALLSKSICVTDFPPHVTVPLLNSIDEHQVSTGNLPGCPAHTGSRRDDYTPHQIRGRFRNPLSVVAADDARFPADIPCGQVADIAYDVGTADWSTFALPSVWPDPIRLNTDIGPFAEFWSGRLGWRQASACPLSRRRAGGYRQRARRSRWPIRQ